MLKLNGDKVVEYVNGELDMEEVKRFDIDLNERNLVIEEKSRPTNAGCRLTEHLIYLHLCADNISKCKHIPYSPFWIAWIKTKHSSSVISFFSAPFCDPMDHPSSLHRHRGSTTMSPGRGTSKTTPTLRRCSVVSRRSSRVRRCKC